MDTNFVFTGALSSLKVGLLYFSGTGLTAELARRIAAEFERLGSAVELRRFTAGMQEPDFERYDLLGFGVPAYSLYAPRIFLRYLRTLNGPEGMPYILFTTAHSMPGIAAAAMDRILLKKGFRRAAPVIEGGGINNIRAWRPKLDKPREQDVFRVPSDLPELIGSAAKAAKTAAEDRDIQPLSAGPAMLLFSRLFTYRWQMAAVEGLRKKIDRERCSKCGLCWEKICPSGAIIRGTHGFPDIIHRKCAGCSGCVNLCPADAVYTRLNRNRQPFQGMKKNILSGY